ncbi:MAG: ATP-binding protein [Treponema sp.]|jgi:AAA+ superfamily predicted ATPase|nr:ATP-binding protein [Treponema sp.]
MDIVLTNLPYIQDSGDKSILNTRVTRAVNDMLEERYQINKPNVTVAAAKPTGRDGSSRGKNEPDNEKPDEAVSINLREPQFTFDQLVLDDKVMEELQYSIKFESVRDKIYEEWGLKKIDPSPKLALNFHGPSGTGKTMAAQAIANVMQKKIILASYAEIESKYHGDGPKNVKRLFNFAAENDAVLFIDEADSLLSRRLTNVTQGSEQAINSMRSQLLIQIEQYSGVVIFATNLAENYDGAFVTRIKSIHFKKPDFEMRRKLWEKMLISTLPLDPEISLEKLAQIEDICGRDIKNAVVKAATKTAIDGDAVITQKHLEDAVRDIIESNKNVSQKQGSLSEEKKQEITRKIKQSLRRGRYKVASLS